MSIISRIKYVIKYGGHMFQLNICISMCACCVILTDVSMYNMRLGRAETSDRRIYLDDYDFEPHP